MSVLDLDAIEARWKSGPTGRYSAGTEERDIAEALLLVAEVRRLRFALTEAQRGVVRSDADPAAVLREMEAQARAEITELEVRRGHGLLSIEDAAFRIATASARAAAYNAAVDVVEGVVL